MLDILEINELERVTKELVDAEKGLVIVRVEVGIDMPIPRKNNVQNNSQMSRCTKLGDWRALPFEGVSSFSTSFNCT
jgi:hypothetical protein